MSSDEIMKLDPLIHAPIRLSVLSVLMTVQSADFAYLKKSTQATDGNLSTHLSKLEAAGYISMTKRFEGKKPKTHCAITPQGRARFIQYIESLQAIVDKQKGLS